MPQAHYKNRNELTEDVILVSQPFSGVTEQRGDGENETFQIQETSLGPVQLDQDGDDAAADRQTQLFVCVWEFSSVKKSGRESIFTLSMHASTSNCNVI